MNLAIAEDSKSWHISLNELGSQVLVISLPSGSTEGRGGLEEDGTGGQRGQMGTKDETTDSAKN